MMRSISCSRTLTSSLGRLYSKKISKKNAAKEEKCSKRKGEEKKKKGEGGVKEKKEDSESSVSPKIPICESMLVGCEGEDTFEKLEISEDWVQPRVVVIGAGMAGLSAAHRLRQAGINSVTVLEAMEMPGGRIKTCKMGDTITELGAQWIWGASPVNPVLGLACQEDLIETPLFRVNPVRGLFMNQEGAVSDPNLVQQAMQLFRRVEETAKDIYRKPRIGEFGSLKSYFENNVEKEIESLSMKDREEALDIIKALMREIQCTWGTELDKISANQYGSHVSMPGGSIFLPKGFIKVLTVLLKQLGRCVICKKPVLYVRWDYPSSPNFPRAIVRCCDGDEFPAEYVILTVSLGVLKSQHQELFCPNLPMDKLEAIHALGYGHINKVIFEYEQPFWIKTEGKVMPLWSEENVSSCPSWARAIGNLEEAPNGDSNVYIATIGGSQAIHLENLPDCDIIQDLTKFIHEILGDTTVPFPKCMMRSSWSTNRYFQGATSYMSVGSNVGHQMKLAQPIPRPSGAIAPVIFFAGEATSPTYYGTVHGARQSGIREAERIIQLTRLFGGPPQLRTFRPNKCILT